MTALSSPPVVDPDALMGVVFKAIDEVGASLGCALAVMGDRLGYYRALADQGPLTPSQLADLTSKQPRIDLEIPFAYKSAAVTAAARERVGALGSALSSTALAGGTFLIAGHTDGRGNDVANQRLSERRAEAVKRYLVERHGIPAASLIAVGYGKARLKNGADPLAGENRRVEVTNISEVKAASR